MKALHEEAECVGKASWCKTIHGRRSFIDHWQLMQHRRALQCIVHSEFAITPWASSDDKDSLVQVMHAYTQKRKYIHIGRRSGITRQ